MRGKFIIILVESGEYCLSGGSDKLIKLWNPLKAYSEPIQVYSGHAWDVSGISIAGDNRNFASVGGDRSCFLWDVSAGRILRRFQGHQMRPSAVSMSENGAVVATGSVDKTVRLWDCRGSSSRFPIQILEHAKDSIGDIQMVESEIIVGSIDGTVRIYDIRNGKMLEDPLGEAVTSVSFSSDRLCYIASCLDSTIRLVDRADGATLNTFRGHANVKYAIKSTFSNTDANIISGSEDGKIYIWDFLSTKIVGTLSGHTDTVSSVSYHPKADIIISASFDGTIKVWI